MREICPKWGYVFLTDINGNTVILPTSCKTWGCSVCQKKLLSAFTMQVQIGIYRLGLCALITLTYKVEQWREEDAEYVTRDWRALFRQSKLLQQKKWLKVTELTKKGMPHHHLIVGPFRKVGDITCQQGKVWSEPLHKRRILTCQCAGHQIARSWHTITHDSYIVHAEPVLSAPGVGRYLGKYLSKGYGSRGLLQALGVKRRWSCSRDYPRGIRPRLRLSKPFGPGWPVVRMTSGLPLHKQSIGGPEYLMRQVGDNLALLLSARAKEHVFENKVRKVIKNEDYRSTHLSNLNR